ncbi:MAG: LytTR family DNA-binding domain-containing protein [Polaribacter sp.]|nr:LytTR family DNA-binding domain-containing protein [Polaribacter sp.]
MIHYLIVYRNEKLAKILEGTLSAFENTICIGVVDDYNTALNITIKEKPFLIFIDFDDNNKEALNLVSEIKLYSKAKPLIVALSETKDYCFEAIKNNLFDYLLYPVQELDLRKCFIKAEKQQRSLLKKNICLKSYNDFRYLNTDEVLFLKADNNTTDFYTNQGRIVTAYRTLKVYEQALPINFLRIHKSFIVNTDFVNRINFGKSVCLIDSDTIHEIPFGKKYHQNVTSFNRQLTQHSFVPLN